MRLSIWRVIRIGRFDLVSNEVGTQHREVNNHIDQFQELHLLP
jgi:hypothetical protein